MAITAFSGPLVVFGQQPAGVGPTPDYNPDLGPSLFYAGAGILDPRAAYSYAPGQGSTALTAGFVGMDNITTLNADTKGQAAHRDQLGHPLNPMTTLNVCTESATPNMQRSTQTDSQATAIAHQHVHNR
jgi:hypothetical protein